MAVNTSALFNLVLVDGLPVIQGDKTVRYKSVVLREINVSHERKAAELSEQLRKIPGGSYRLVVSDESYALSLVMLACEKFEQVGLESIDEHVLDLDLMGKLSRPDLTAIEERVALIEMAALVRHGQMDETEFSRVLDEAFAKSADQDGAPEKRSEGQTAGDDVDGHASGPSIEMLADNTGVSN